MSANKELSNFYNPGRSDILAVSQELKLRDHGESKMVRILIAGVIGGIVYYVWGMLAWMAFPLHTPTMNMLPNEAQISQALKGQDLETGMYTIPFMKDGDAWQDPESEFGKAHRAGPIVSIFYRKEGTPPMPAKMMFTGFGIDFLGAALAACLLSSVGSGGANYWCRVGFVAGLGIFVALMAHGTYWNWLYFPTDYTIAFMVDAIVGSALAGLAIAAIVKPAASVQQTVAVAAPPTTAAAPAAASKPVTPPAPIRNDAISLLAALQREARFIDIVKEPLGDYSDAQVGAAARDVLRDCGAVLDRLFQIQPVVDQQEGSEIELPDGFDATQYRVTGNASDESSLSGSLTHHGWRATHCELPKWSGSKATALIVAPAELEVK